METVTNVNEGKIGSFKVSLIEIIGWKVCENWEYSNRNNVRIKSNSDSNFILTHFRPMHHLRINQVVGFY